MYTRPFMHTFRTAAIAARIPGAHKFLLLVMAEYANSEGDNVYPSQATLGRGTCTTDRTVRRNLANLQKAGWVELLKRGHSGADGRGARANRYKLSVGRDFSLTKSGDAVLHAPAATIESDTTSAPPVLGRSTESAREVTVKCVPNAAEAITPPLPLPELVEAAVEADEDDGWAPSHS